MLSRVFWLGFYGVALLGACGAEENGTEASNESPNLPAKPGSGSTESEDTPRPLTDAGMDGSNEVHLDEPPAPSPTTDEPAPGGPEPALPEAEAPPGTTGTAPHGTGLDASAPNPEGPSQDPEAPEPEGPRCSPETGEQDAGHSITPNEHSLRLDFQAIPLSGADFVTDFVFIPGTSELLVATKDGAVYHLALDGDATELLGQFQLAVYDELDCGLISLALDPDFANNGFVYFGLCTDIRTSGIYRVEWSPTYEKISQSQTEIISVGGEPVSEGNERPWHNVGALDFSEDGVLWVAFGDKVRSNTAQDPTDDLGSLLRIVPNRESDGSGHAPAPGNAFFDGIEASANVYALGLRSPWRGTLDHLGRYFIGDVGSDFFEEIDMVDAPGQNFGWPDSEGPCEENCDGVVDPVTSWSRELDHPYVLDDLDANPIGGRVGAVGVEYVDRGNDRYATRLTNRVVFTDVCIGWIRSLEVDAGGQVVNDQHIGHLNHAAAWRQGPDGYLYAVTFGRCQTDRANVSDAPSQLYRAVPVDDP
jgi:glucose/arabinose dehydrogenase